MLSISPGCYVKLRNDNVVGPIEAVQPDLVVHQADDIVYLWRYGNLTWTREGREFPGEQTDNDIVEVVNEDGTSFQSKPSMASLSNIAAEVDNEEENNKPRPVNIIAVENGIIITTSANTHVFSEQTKALAFLINHFGSVLE